MRSRARTRNPEIDNQLTSPAVSKVTVTNAAIYNKDESYNLFPLTFLYRLLGVMACLVHRYVEQRYPESISNVT